MIKTKLPLLHIEGSQNLTKEQKKELLDIFFEKNGISQGWLDPRSYLNGWKPVFEVESVDWENLLVEVTSSDLHSDMELKDIVVAMVFLGKVENEKLIPNEFLGFYFDSKARNDGAYWDSDHQKIMTKSSQKTI